MNQAILNAFGKLTSKGWSIDESGVSDLKEAFDGAIASNIDPTRGFDHVVKSLFKRGWGVGAIQAYEQLYTVYCEYIREREKKLVSLPLTNND